MVNVSNAAEYVALATIQGAIVALPHPAALERLGRLRSPAWALVAPGSILVGTFGILALPLVARGLAVLAQMATPVLAAIAVLAVVHGRQRRLLLVPVALGAIAAGGWGWAGEVAASLLTALGCLTLGAALVRLTPARWLYVGVLGMAAVDVLLLAVGVGQPADALLRDALGNTIQPTLAHAELGQFSLDYPDLVLAAVLGAIVAERAVQRRAAVLVAISAVAYGALFTFADVLPATGPASARPGAGRVGSPARSATSEGRVARSGSRVRRRGRIRPRARRRAACSRLRSSPPARGRAGRRPSRGCPRRHG